MKKQIKKKKLKLCKLEFCNRKCKIKGLCQKHYNAQHHRRKKYKDNIKQLKKDNNQENKGMIYFIQAGNNAVKIGFSKNSIESRLAALQTAHYEELRILHLFKGSLTTERNLHFIARKHHIRGEWFDLEVLKNSRIKRIINKRKKIQIEPELKIERHTLKKLRILRKTNGLMGMEELACKIGVTARTIYRWESGESMPQQHLNEKLISLLNGGDYDDSFEQDIM